MRVKHECPLRVGLIDDSVDLGATETGRRYNAPDSDARIGGSAHRRVAPEDRPFSFIERVARDTCAVRDGCCQLSEPTVNFIVHSTSVKGRQPWLATAASRGSRYVIRENGVSTGGLIATNRR